MYEEAIREAFAAKFEPTRASGCGRSYVILTGLDAKAKRAVAAACKKLGLIWQGKAYYGFRNAIYVGYDNGTGRELGRADKIVEVLKAHGIQAYADAGED